MGTSSVTYIQENGKSILVFYRHFDGYISGHGVDLGNILKGRDVVNGIQLGKESFVFNNVGCLATNVLSMVKQKTDGIGNAGGLYVLHSDFDDYIGQEYEYIIDVTPTNIHNPFSKQIVEIRVLETHSNDSNLLFNGGVEEYLQFLKSDFEKM